MIQGVSQQPMVPLAERLRPRCFDEFAGLECLDSDFIAQLRAGSGRIPSLILWGPPGTGKTTLAKLVGGAFDCRFVELSAVLSGVKDVRAVVENAKNFEEPTLLFVDEIHRFNKAQQDAFLPHVESGRIALIGATTENPSFYLTRALLSRCRLLVLSPLDDRALCGVLERAIVSLGAPVEDGAKRIICDRSQGDARRMLNLYESIVQAWQLVSDTDGQGAVKESFVLQYLENAGIRVYDRDGEEHYNLASAFIKSLRGSDPDAALYYGFRMLDGGEDPRFLIRRLVIFASEDIGNADSRALQLAVATLSAFELVGLPEGRIPIAQCITYLATAPKSNRSYVAMHRALQAVAKYPSAPVPLSLRNGETSLMRDLGYGKGYEYPHDADGAFLQGKRYLPDNVEAAPFYEPSDRGAEKTIRDRQEWLRKRAR
jgi:putative ATPase